MKCPYCDQEMKNGYIRALGRGGICWVGETAKNNMLIGARFQEGFLQLGKSPVATSALYPASNCESCKRIVVDYSTDNKGA